MGGVAGTVAQLNPGLIVADCGGCCVPLPLMWLMLRRKRRFNKFAKQLPDALELIARALRAGHSLASGFNLVADEMTAADRHRIQPRVRGAEPGHSHRRSAGNMTKRMPNLDLRFFATAVILQRQTGGDLAEILDKIGHLIRERFKIFGQVQALTGEGRLSGIVLLALPPVLFLAVYRLNPEYVMPLFTDPLGKKMLVGAVGHADSGRPGDSQNRQHQGLTAVFVASPYDCYHDTLCWLNQSRWNGCCRWPCSAPWRPGVWWLLDMMVAGQAAGGRTARRAQQSAERGGDGDAGRPRRPTRLRDMLAKASPRLAAPLQPKTAEEAGKLKSKLAMAGFRGETRREHLPGLEVRRAVGRLCARRRRGPARHADDRQALINTVAVAGVMFYLPEHRAVVSRPSSARTASFSACPTRSTCWSSASRPAWVSTRRCAR